MSSFRFINNLRQFGFGILCEMLTYTLLRFLLINQHDNNLLIDAEWRILVSGKSGVIGSDDGLWSVHHQAILLTYPDLLTIRYWETNFHKKFRQVSFKKINLDMSQYIKRCPESHAGIQSQHLSLNVQIILLWFILYLSCLSYKISGLIVLFFSTTFHGITETIL